MASQLADLLNLTFYTVKTDFPNGSFSYTGMLRFWSARKELNRRKREYWWCENRMAPVPSKEK